MYLGVEIDRSYLFINDRILGLNLDLGIRGIA